MPDDVRILVLSDRRASPDGGEHFYNYVADKVYSGGTVPPMSPDLAAQAVREAWGEAIRDGANRKRSESQKGIPKAEKERVPTTSGRTSAQLKASASGTNRGTVEREAQQTVSGWLVRDGQEAKAHNPALDAREAPAGPDAACLWCRAAYARRATGGRPQKFCGSGCRRACHAAARRWAVLELEAGRLTVETVLGRG